MIELFEQIDNTSDEIISCIFVIAFALIILIKIVLKEFKNWQEFKRFFSLNKFK